MKIILFFGYTNNLLYLCTISNEKTTFMKNYTIKHIHQDVSHFNGRLYFTLDGRLLILTVGTPNFNDYGEWRLEEFKFSKFPYDPEGDEAPLTPYEIEDIIINETEFNEFESVCDVWRGDSGLTQDEIKKFNSEHSNWKGEMACGTYKDNDFLTIFNDDDVYNRKDVHYPDWESSTDKTLFERIFYPIMKGFVNQYGK